MLQSYQIQMLSKQTKSSYFVINKAKRREVWKGINQLICLKSNGSTLPSKLIINEHETTSHKVIADQFNIFFSNIGKNLASAVPKPNLAIDYYLDKPQASSFSLSPTNSTEIENLIMYLSSTKACDPFSISTSLLKTLKSVLSVPLQLLFNCSFSTGMVPDQFQLARVVPIHKKRVQLFSLQL